MQGLAGLDQRRDGVEIQPGTLSELPRHRDSYLSFARIWLDDDRGDEDDVQEHTWMSCDRELPIGFLDFELGSHGLDAQGLVVCCIGNHGQPSRMRCGTRSVSAILVGDNENKMQSGANSDNRMTAKEVNKN